VGISIQYDKDIDDEYDKNNDKATRNSLIDEYKFTD
jgi:hypothetical protein